MTDKANIWQSKDEWNFLANDTLGMYIENTSKDRVLGIANGGKVIEEEYVKDNKKQLWERGVADSEGYFTFTNSESKFLTAVSTDILEIKGAYN